MLSPVPQDVYLGTLRDLLDLAAKKRLIAVNPAIGLKPLKRDTVAAAAKREPFTLQQIKQFFVPVPESTPVLVRGIAYSELWNAAGLPQT